MSTRAIDRPRAISRRATTMNTNVGTIDRILRFVAGLALIALALGYIPGFAPQVWGWIGIIPLLTAVFGTCPLYSMIGVNTCKRG